MHTNRYLYDAMNHYGIHNFEITCVEECTSEEELNAKEKFWIKKLNTMNKSIGYNMQEGGIGGALPKEIRSIVGKKVAQSRKNNGYRVSEETKQKISLAHKGKQISQDQRNAISSTLKIKFEQGILISQLPILGQVGEKHPMWGRTHTDATKDKLSKARLGKKYEDFMSSDKAKKLKDERAKYCKEHNPNNKGYIIPDMDQLLLNLDAGANEKELCNIFGITPYFLRKSFVAAFGINLNKYRQLHNILILNKRQRKPLSQEVKDNIAIGVKNYYRRRRA
jgi:group I intron endonuclease